MDPRRWHRPAWLPGGAEPQTLALGGVPPSAVGSLDPPHRTACGAGVMRLWTAQLHRTLRHMGSARGCHLDASCAACDGPQCKTRGHHRRMITEEYSQCSKRKGLVETLGSGGGARGRGGVLGQSTAVSGATRKNSSHGCKEINGFLGKL